jgi:NAD(P)-dependent dehydrogenase (short-subunit alcohol dehydrogenase family)
MDRMTRIADLLRMDGHVAIVTGGTGHLGTTFGEALAECGAHVVLVDLDDEHCAASAKRLSTHGGVEAMGLAADLADAAAPRRIVERVFAKYGRIDSIVNNAALTGATVLNGYAVPFHQQTAAAWRAALDVNLSAAFFLTQAASSILERSSCGTVVNIGSIYGVVGPNMALYGGTPMGNPAAYAASKGGLLQLTRYLATVLAPRVRVNTIVPGGIARGQPKAFVDRYISLTPMGRMGTEDDFKVAVAYLASRASSYMTGQSLVIDGGWTAW